MIKLTLNPIVLATLKQAMPKTNKAQLALDKYVSVLETNLDKSLLYMNDNRYKLLKLFVVSPRLIMVQSGQFVINGEKQYLQDWLNKANLALINIEEIGVIGGEYSRITLTKLVTLTDQLDLAALGKKELSQIDQWLADKSLSDEEFIEKVFPDLLEYADASQVYDTVPVDIVSLQRYITWLIKNAVMLNSSKKQKLLRQAHLILRVAQITSGVFPQKKNPSVFGRNYYHGISIQSVHKSLREALLGDCYEYDLRSAAISWKLGFADALLHSEGNTQALADTFGATLFYLEQKKAFTDYVINATFINSGAAHEVKEDIIKQALTALSFGAQIRTQGWIDQSGKKTNPALVAIIKNKDHRNNFIRCDLITDFMAEQKRLDKYIYDHFTITIFPDLIKKPELQTQSGRPSKNKVMAYLFQHAETHIMNLVAREIEKTNNEILARVHDAIFVKHKISVYDRELIESTVCSYSGIEYWKLKEDQIKRYGGISQQTLEDELAHLEHIAAETKRAQGYVGQWS
jgi:hypothetical protein